MKNFLKYLALGMCLSLPVIVYAQAPSSFDNGFPSCCPTACGNAASLADCKTMCDKKCSGQIPVDKCKQGCDGAFIAPPVPVVPVAQ